MRASAYYDNVSFIVYKIQLIEIRYKNSGNLYDHYNTKDKIDDGSRMLQTSIDNITRPTNYFANDTTIRATLN